MGFEGKQPIPPQETRKDSAIGVYNPENFVGDEDNRLFQEESFRYLTETGDPDTLKYFQDHFSGKLSSDGRGYLLDKEGKETDLLPSHVIGVVGDNIVRKIVKEKLKSDEFASPKDVTSPKEIQPLKEGSGKIEEPSDISKHVSHNEGGGR